MVHRALWVSILVQLPLTPVLFSQQRTPASDTNARVLIELIMGGAGAAGGAYTGAWLGARILGPDGGEDPGLFGAVIGAIVGTPLGASVGAYLGARTDHTSARFVDALGGAGIGMATFLLVRPFTRLDPDYPSFWVAFLGMPVAGAVIFEEIGIRNHRVQLQLWPGAHGMMVGARVKL